MKIYGNKTAYEILDKIQQKIKSGQIKSWFFLLSWPANVWKKSAILNLINSLGVLPQDLMVVEDPGKIDGNLYQIKVDVPEKERILKVNDKEFLNVWARQIIDFLSTTSFWNYKIVFIENIERMNISAANALLKNLEEPGENKFIFATCSNQSKLLPTILSRAFIINFYPVSFSEFVQFLKDSLINISEVKQKILYAVSAGRIWLAKKLLENNDDLLDLIEEFIQLDQQSKEIYSKFSLIKDLIQQQKIYSFLDWLAFYYSYSGNFDKVIKLIDIKQKTFSNVNIENLMFGYLLN